MTVVKELDAVRLSQPVEADVMGLGRAATIVMPTGSKGVVVHVHGPATKPLAYEVEFYIEAMDAVAIATSGGRSCNSCTGRGRPLSDQEVAATRTEHARSLRNSISFAVGSWRTKRSRTFTMAHMKS